MKRIMAAAALTAALGLAACGDSKPADAAADAAAAAPAADTAATAPDHAAAADAATPLVVASPAAPDAPAFAQLYPGASVTDPAITAKGPDGRPGGIVTFTTAAAPEAVIAFYRQRAEGAGLASVSTLNRGGTSAYGAASADGSGSLLNVVANTVAEGETTVQLSWTDGK